MPLYLVMTSDEEGLQASLEPEFNRVEELRIRLVKADSPEKATEEFGRKNGWHHSVPNPKRIRLKVYPISYGSSVGLTGTPQEIYEHVRA